MFPGTPFSSPEIPFIIFSFIKALPENNLATFFVPYIKVLFCGRSQENHITSHYDSHFRDTPNLYFAYLEIPLEEDLRLDFIAYTYKDDVKMMRERLEDRVSMRIPSQCSNRQ